MEKRYICESDRDRVLFFKHKDCQLKVFNIQNQLYFPLRQIEYIFNIDPKRKEFSYVFEHAFCYFYGDTEYKETLTVVNEDQARKLLKIIRADTPDERAEIETWFEKLCTISYSTSKDQERKKNVIAEIDGQDIFCLDSGDVIKVIYVGDDIFFRWFDIWNAFDLVFLDMDREQQDFYYYADSNPKPRLPVYSYYIDEHILAYYNKRFFSPQQKEKTQELMKAIRQKRTKDAKTIFSDTAEESNEEHKQCEEENKMIAIHGSLMTTSYLAKNLNTSNAVILRNAKKCFPNKKIENGVPTYWTEPEATVLIEFMRNNNNRSDTASFNTVAKVSTSLTPTMKLQEQIETAKSLPRQDKLTLALSTFQSLLEDLQAENQLLKPKAEFYDTVADSRDAIDMKSVAKVLNKKIGRNRLFEFLREKEILDRHNQPYQRYIDSGYFRVVECSSPKNNGRTKIYLQTLVLQKGIEFINKLLSGNERK